MKIQENPFYILGATLRDSRQKIMSLAEEKSLELDDAICTEARMVLTNPRRRLTAELSWFPGTSIKQTQVIINEFLGGSMNNTEMNELIKKLNPVSAFNALLSYICVAKRLSEKNFEGLLFSLAQAYNDINVETVLKIINEEREVSGFSTVDNTGVITEELENIRVQSIQNLQTVLEGRSLTSLNHIMMGILEREKKSHHTLELVQDYIDKLYAMVVQKDLDKMRQGLEESIETIKKSATRKNVSKTYLSNLVDKFLDELENFDNVMQPIQLSMQKRGLEHENSRSMAQKSRELAIYLSNHLDDLKLTERIVQKTKELFVELGSVEQSLAGDLETIKDLNEREKERNKAITCHIEKRGIFTTKEISISPKGIQYKDELYKLDEITFIRYGSIRRYVNGMYQGTDTLVCFGDKNYTVNINWMPVGDFSTFTNALWRAVGSKIIMYMVAQLAQKKNLYGRIFNDGVRLTKSKFFSTETKFFKWKDVVSFGHQGSLYIVSRKDKDFSVSFSFMDEENAHVLYNLLEFFKTRGTDTISEAFGMTLAEAKKEKQVDYSDGNSYDNSYSEDDDEDEEETSHPARQQSSGTGEEFSWPLFWAIIIGVFLLFLVFAE